MKKLSTQEKIGIVLLLISIITIFLKVFKIEETISEYGSYAATMGAVFWYLGRVQRKKAEKENKTKKDDNKLLQ